MSVAAPPRPIEVEPSPRSASGAVAVAAPGVGASPDRLAPSDLAELLASFSEVTRRLESTHEALRAEVAGLQSQLREANEQLRRSQSLAALGEVAAGIAHEVRNPLAAVALHARLLEADLADRPAQRGAAVKIRAAVSVADAVVTDVLAFAKDIRARPVETTAQIALDDAAEACAHLFAARAGVRLIRRDGGGRSALIPLVCDPALVRQALVNVLRNAIDAIDDAPPPPGGHAVTLDASRASALTASGEREPMVVLTVRDTGAGLPPGVVERMFNPFFTTRAAGTGLGLAIVHRIVDAHGGRITVRNAEPPGSGALVELLLPETPLDPQEPPA